MAGGKKPNSYVYRFTPVDKTDLTKGGRCRRCRCCDETVRQSRASQLSADPGSKDIADLHNVSRSFATRWVTVHTGTDLFDATAAAAAADATPVQATGERRLPPGTGFGEFYFTETGDTSTTSTLPGAYGGVFRLKQSAPSSPTGRINAVVVGDKDHAGLDNIAFATEDQLLVFEDAGDSMHAQRNALDSGFAIELRGDDHRGRVMTRWLAEGRDASALYDATTSPATTTATTRSPASTSPTVTPPLEGCSARSSLSPSTALACLLDPAARRQRHLGSHP